MKTMNNTIQNKSILIVWFVLALIAMASCSKSDDVNHFHGTDDRDQFEGSYKVNAEGTVTLHYGNQNETIPVNVENESMTITKSSSNATEVIVSGFLNQVATVLGSNIYFESSTETVSQEGITMTLTFDVKKGTLKENVLDFKIEVFGNTNYQGYAFPTSGTISCIATKY